MAEKRKPGRTGKKGDIDRSESNSPTLEFEVDEDGGSRKGKSKGTRALTKLVAKEDANSLFMSNFDPSVRRKAKQKDKTYKDQNIPGTKNVRKDFKKECLYDSKGILLLVCSLGIPGISSLKYFQFEILERS